MTEQQVRQAQFTLGLAQKAGKIASGDFAVTGALKSGKALLLVLATDASVNTEKELVHLATMSKVKVLKLLPAAELGRAIGKSPRASLVVEDGNFVKMLLKIVVSG